MKKNAAEVLHLLLSIARRQYAARDLAHATRIYQELRDKSGQGGSRFPRGEVSMPDGRELEISYNGRVWDGETCVLEADGSKATDNSHPALRSSP